MIVRDLPKLWLQSLKDNLDGELSGKAAIEVTLEEGQVRVSGNGEGAIDKAVVAGFPAKEPIALALITEDGRLKFRSPESMSKIAMAFLTPATTAAPPPEPPSSVEAQGPSPAGGLDRLPKATASAIDRAVGVLGSGLSTVGSWLNRKPGAAAETSYLEAKLALDDVDLGELLRRLAVKLPFPVEGKLSFQVEAGIPINTPNDMKAYRLNGTATLPRLNVAGVELTDVRTSLRYEDGVMKLQELKSGIMAPKGGPDAAGAFAGTARMELAPLGDLSGDFHIDRFPLEMALSPLPGASGKAVGAVSGRVEAHGLPVKTLTDPTTWHATGKLSSERIEVYGLALTNVAADLAVDGGRPRRPA